jgi:hypothetical protein
MQQQVIKTTKIYIYSQTDPWRWLHAMTPGEMSTPKTDNHDKDCPIMERGLLK